MDFEQLNKHYNQLEEPTKSCFIYLRQYFLSIPEMDERYKYKLPFFYYKNKPFCYLHKDKNNRTYIGFNRANLIEHSALIKGNRKKMKVLNIAPNKDIDIQTLQEVVSLLTPFYT